MLEFRLVYQGILLSSGNKPQPHNKHDIRLYLHKQMVNVWKKRSPICEIHEHEFRLKAIADFHSRSLTKKFLPLVKSPMYCSLDILLLRRDSNRILVSGDLDGRIKTLIDALAFPNVSENTETDQPEPKLIYCLMKDDSLVSEVRVVADHLFASPEQVIESPRITPAGEYAESNNHVLAVIDVKIGLPEMNGSGDFYTASWDTLDGE